MAPDDLVFPWPGANQKPEVEYTWPFVETPWVGYEGPLEFWEQIAAQQIEPSPPPYAEIIEQLNSPDRYSPSPFHPAYEDFQAFWTDVARQWEQFDQRWDNAYNHFLGGIVGQKYEDIVSLSFAVGAAITGLLERIRNLEYAIYGKGIEPITGVRNPGFLEYVIRKFGIISIEDWIARCSSFLSSDAVAAVALIKSWERGAMPLPWPGEILPLDEERE